MSGKQRTVTVVIPTLNEAENLTELTGRLFRAFDSGGLSGEVIIVDDDSQDGTVELCEELADRFNIRLITRNGERGLATAALFGMRAANRETIVVMDADLSHPPESLPKLVQACNGDTDCGMAVASRYVVGGTLDPSWGRWRHVNSWVATPLARGLTRVADPMSGFFAIRIDVFRRLVDLRPQGYKICLELLVKARQQAVPEIPIHFSDRIHGESKLSVWEQIAFARHLGALYAWKYPVVRELMLFSMVGLSGLAIDLTSFAIALRFSTFALARAAAIWLAMTWNYVWNRRLTFSQLRGQRFWSLYTGFCGACFVGAACNWAVTMCLGTFMGMAPVKSAFCGAVVAMLANFVLCRVWVFASSVDVATGVLENSADQEPKVDDRNDQRLAA